MPHDRFFLEDFADNLEIRDKEHHHLVNVMRKEVGEIIEVVNGKGVLIKARIEKIDKKVTLLKVVSKTEALPNKNRLILAQALPKIRSNLDFIIEKGCELGVDEFWLFSSKYSGKNLAENHYRLNQINISALKQCGRLFLPKILSFKNLSSIPKEKEISYLFGQINGKRITELSLSHAISSALIFIGPESGFTEEEIEILKENFQAFGVSLNKNILRAETASIAAVTLLANIMP